MLSQAQFDVFVDRIQQVCNGSMNESDNLSGYIEKAVTHSKDKVIETQQTMIETQIPSSLAEQKKQRMNREQQQKQQALKNKSDDVIEEQTTQAPQNANRIQHYDDKVVKPDEFNLVSQIKSRRKRMRPQPQEKNSLDYSFE